MKVREKVGALAAVALMAPALGFLAASPAGAAPPPPVVTGVSPSSGTSVTSGTASATTPGGTAVTITGANFTGETAVDFGSVPATGITVVSDTTITATSPAVTNTIGNTVDVRVTTPLGTSATGVDDEFTYPYNYTSAGSIPESSITLAASAPNTSTGGTVTLTATAPTDVGPSPDFGLSIVDVTNAAAPVAVAHTPSGVTVSAPVTKATAQTDRYVAAYDACTVFPNPCPPGALAIPGARDGGVSAPVTVTWSVPSPLAPTVTAVSPTSGSTAGGTSVTITGTNLTGATAVDFGGKAASSYDVVSSTSATAISPAGAAGAVDVTVTTAGGTSATGAADEFTYVTPQTQPTGGYSLVASDGGIFNYGDAGFFGSAGAIHLK
jgi:hypothetical protein